MNVKAKLNSYESVEFSITLTAPVEDWRAALKQLEKLKQYGYYTWPMGGFVDCIQKMLNDLDKTHFDVLIRDDQLQTKDQ